MVLMMVSFYVANNGADPTFETVNTDLVSDTTPQLGGDLDSNGNNIKLRMVKS